MPHHSFESPHRQREHYIIDELAKSDEVHVVSWTDAETVVEFFDPRRFSRSLISHVSRTNYLVHHIRRLNIPTSFPRRINEAFFQSSLRRIVDKEDVDAVVIGPSAFKIGYPQENLGVPILFDYSDYLFDRHQLARYLGLSSAVLCVSRSLIDDVTGFEIERYYVPNGVDCHKFSKGRREATRARYNIDADTVVIGLIGVTFGEYPFFLDASRFLSEKIGRFVFMVVGGGRRLNSLISFARKAKAPAVFTGWVPYEGIEDYFAAIDLGVYPADQNVYFDSAFPIKILEYSAAGKPVVSTDLKEVRNLGFQNVFLCQPNPQDFADKVEKGIHYQGEYPSLDQYSWSSIAKSAKEAIQSNLAT